MKTWFNKHFSEIYLHFQANSGLPRPYYVPNTTLDEFYCVPGLIIGEVLLCARLQAEKAPTVGQPKLAETLLYIEFFG